MTTSADLKFLEKMADEAKDLEDRLGSEDHWAKPFYSDLQVFKPGIPRIFIGLNPGGDGGSRKYYEADDSETKLRSGNTPYFNAYLNENWGSTKHKPIGKGKAPLQIATKEVFRTLFKDEWETTLRNTPCFNMIPVCSGKATDPKIDEIWNRGVKWGFKLVKYLEPQSIILFSNNRSKSAKSAWRALDQNLSIIDQDSCGGIPPNYSIYVGVIRSPWKKDLPVLGLPPLYRVREGKPLYALRERLKELMTRYDTQFRKHQFHPNLSSIKGERTV